MVLKPFQRTRTGQPFAKDDSLDETPDEPAKKRQYIRQWVEAHDPPIKAADIERETGIDKSTISRWMTNPYQIPQNESLRPLAKFFKLKDPASFLRHPDDEWLAQKFEDYKDDPSARKRMRQTLDAAFPSKTSRAS